MRFTPGVEGLEVFTPPLHNSVFLGRRQPPDECLFFSPDLGGAKGRARQWRGPKVDRSRCVG